MFITGSVLILAGIALLLPMQWALFQAAGIKEFSAVTSGNRLQFEKSPYLLQHADNPVDWYPWGNEAFEKARNEEKPIFLSIGYSTCHWCHVMEHESFEDIEVAQLMNEVFVAIKVDREERPDIDHLYMTVSQLLTGSGGWPLNVIMTPEKKPFFAGTYFPKHSRFGRIGMLDLIPQIQQIWEHDREKALQTAEQVMAGLQDVSNPTVRSRATEEKVLGEAVLHEAYRQLADRFDEQYGGFGTAPKFPTPHTLPFLLRYWKRTGEEQALKMAEQTLQAMRLGGIYDHIGFGFHRYSTDAQWLLPHFEKMLYDQALIAMAYIDAYQATHKQEYARTAREIFTYVLRDMTAPEGGFYSAEDADSDGREGAFYVWSVQEIQELLGAQDAEVFSKVFNFEKNGNFKDQATQLKTGENIVHLKKPLSELAPELDMTEDELQHKIDHLRQGLFAVREDRVHPHKDDKILTDWNGLMIAALARGARVLDEPRYAEAAEQAMSFLLEKLRDKKGRLLHRYRDGEAAVPAYVDDYAFLIWGLLELYETTFNVSYLDRALTLNQDMLQRFWDDAPVSMFSGKQKGGFFFTADDGEKLPVRQKQIYDGAIPSGNAVAMLNLLRLGRLTARAELEEKAARLSEVFAETVRQAPSAYTFLMLGVDFGLGPSYEVVVVGKSDADDTRQMLRTLRRHFLPNKVVLLRPAEETTPDILRLAPYAEPYLSLDGTKATVYVCRNYVCSLPTTDTETVLSLFRPEDSF